MLHTPRAKGLDLVRLKVAVFAHVRVASDSGGFQKLGYPFGGLDSKEGR